MKTIAGHADQIAMLADKARSGFMAPEVVMEVLAEIGRLAREIGKLDSKPTTGAPHASDRT